MATGASDHDLDATEQRLGVTLPIELRRLLLEHAGSQARVGESFLMIYDLDALVGVNQEIERHPGLLVFASDGSRELIGLDLRAGVPPVVMVDITSEGWDDA